MIQRRSVIPHEHLNAILTDEETVGSIDYPIITINYYVD
ncbi:unnamed protein product [Brassica rapa subsp. narinosa]